jgi:uncharacterized protein (TIGR02246 family)
MKAEKSKGTDEAQLRGVIESWASALRVKDIDGVLSNYAPDVLSFDVINPLHYSGLDMARKRTEEWFASFSGPIGCEIRDLSITPGKDVAFSHSLNHFTGTKTDGEEIDMWVRATICYQKVDNNWLVKHQHISVPFDMKSGKASLDLKP